MTKTGRLFGIGIGPGDPDLLTLKAIKALKEIDIILAASSPKNDYSVALEIARPHINEEAQIEFMKFPMTRDENEREEAWLENSRRTVHLLKQGKDIAFLTLGDPLVYSTFGYLMRKLNIHAPEIEIKIIPGITSFQAAAAKTNTILCEDGESLTIFPGIAEDNELADTLKTQNNVVILKTYKNINTIKNTIKKLGREKNFKFISNLHLKDEFITNDLSLIPEKPSYFSLIIAKD